MWETAFSCFNFRTSSLENLTNQIDNEKNEKMIKEKEFDGSLEKIIAVPEKNLNFFGWILNNPPVFPFDILN